MTWVAAAVIGSAVVGAGASYFASQNSADAAKSAANAQLQSTQEGQQLLRDMYAKNAPYWTPYTALGERGVSQINQMLPYLTHEFTASDLQSGLAPNYQFMLGQGLGAQRQAQNVGGGGSNVARAADIFSQNYAGNAYQQAFNNYQAQRTNIYNTLQSIAGIGQQGAAGLSNLGSGVATNIANLGIQGANAQAAGTIGQANAISGGITGVANTLGNAGLSYALLNQNAGNVGGTPYTTPSPTGPGTYNVGGGQMTITPLG